MSQYDREVLLCVSGLSPQIITETVYAMAVSGAGGERIVPDEVHVVTTTVGRDRIRQKLLQAPTGHLLALRRDYGLGDKAALPDENIHVITGADGEPLDDIRNDDDNTAVADLLTRLIQQLTRDERTRLHVSIAGGRKTMGFYAGYALSLYGRAWDRLSHVLVNAPFESGDFFYPPPEPRELNVGSEQEPRWVNTSDARISLGYIPVVRMRDGLGEAVLKGALSFGDAVERAQQLFEPPRVVIYRDDMKVWLQGSELPLTEREFYWFYLLAKRAKNGDRVSASDKGLKDEMSSLVFAVSGRDVDEFQWFDKDGDLDKNNFATIRTTVNKKIKGLNFSKAVMSRYLIQSDGKNLNKLYWLQLGPEDVEIRRTP